jgi:hypothetical protein
MVVTRSVAPLCPIRFLFRCRNKTGLWRSPWPRRSCDYGREGDDDEFETHFDPDALGSKKTVDVATKSQDRESWMRDPTTFTQFTMRHAALFVFHSQGRYAAQYELMRFHLGVQ